MLLTAISCKYPSAISYKYPFTLDLAHQVTCSYHFAPVLFSLLALLVSPSLLLLSRRRREGDTRRHRLRVARQDVLGT
jgi:hypothetical protein